MKSSKKSKVNLAIFASGTGSDAEKICSYFKDHPVIKVNLIVTNNADAGVIQVASKYNIESICIQKKQWADTSFVLFELENRQITHIILAGFLLLIPQWLIEKFKGRILNIHPALLPKYGGKGMYGHHIHEKIKASGELISGITIHEVNEHYDDGTIIFQESIHLDPDDSASVIGQKVLQLEHFYYPRIIEKWVNTV